MDHPKKTQSRGQHSGPDRSVEPTLNVYLAELLRNQGLDASAERRTNVQNRGHQPDVIVERTEDCIAVECEFEPARTLQADAASRLASTENPIIWHGLPIRLALAVTYPDYLRATSDARLKEELASCNKIGFQLAIPNQDGQITWEGDNRGSVRDVADVLTSHWIRSGEDERINHIVEMLDAALSSAAEILSRAPTTNNSELKEISSEPERVMSLIWANAMVFHELLAITSKDNRIPIPTSDSSVDELLGQWAAILQINYWPIFHTASEALRNTPANLARLTINALRPAVREIAESGMASRHDWAGRVFHRLLENRKLLATNYTTIPSAILLAKLALGANKLPIDQRNINEWSQLRIVDPCCGTGTLLMAAFQEAVTLHRRSAGISFREALDNLFRPMMEDILHGYDVVPSAVHLTAATLAMSDPNRVIQKNALWIMPYMVERGVGKSKKICRLGSLDFLRSARIGQGPTTLSLFSAAGIEEPSDRRVEGKGEQRSAGSMPEPDLIIMNPPYTRAGGPGKSGSTEWNPIFGSVLSKDDVALMQKELVRRNSKSAASVLAGLGSSFVVLADDYVKENGIIAFVLPAVVGTGSSWEEIRKLLLRKYRIDWIITSHDPRTRGGKGHLPGRNYVSFSESTRMSEVLIVGVKTHVVPKTHRVRFANLRRNVDHPVAAFAVGRALLSLAESKEAADTMEVLTGSEFWGEVIAEPQHLFVDGSRWTATAYSQHLLHTVTETLVRKNSFQASDSPPLSIPMAKLSSVAKPGPYHLQIKGNQAPYRIIETDDMTRGRPAIWHHKSDKVRVLTAKPDSVLQALPNRKADADRLWEQRSRLHITEELRHAPQRVAAVWSQDAMLGVRAWKSLTLLNAAEESDKITKDRECALAIWLNSTLGLLTRIPYANRPYLGRTGLPSDVLVDLPILDVRQLSSEALRAARNIWNDLANAELMGFADTPKDIVRQELNHRLITEILGGSPEIAVGLKTIAEQLSAEPVVYVRA